MDQLLQLLKKAGSINVTTHRECDGDGLGAMLAFYHALLALGLKAKILTVDEVPRKYTFLPGFEKIVVFDPQKPRPHSDLLIAFDTIDARRIEPLFSWAQQKGQVVFIDHHPVLEKGPHPGHNSYINTQAASTGEMTFELIKSLKIPLNAAVAECLYTSIVFDTQLFRFIRKSPRSHEIAAELMEHDFDPTEIHRRLFGEHTPEKLKFLAQALSKIEYLRNNQVAYLSLAYEDFQKYGVDPETSRDVVDMMMNVRNVELAILMREDAKRRIKVSIRSKGRHEVLSLAEIWGGGGHLYSAGATLENSSFDKLRSTLDEWVDKHL